MKTETAIVLVVLIIGGVAAYKLFARQQTIAAAQPLGANVGTLNAAGQIGGALLTNLENYFGNSNSNTAGYTSASDLTPITVDPSGSDWSNIT